MVKSWSVSSLLATTCAVLAAAEESSVFSKASNESLLWGPYRPNLYFGLRPRLPQSILTGLLWGRVEDFSTIQHNMRFTCEQNEGMAGYGWNAYDPRTGGVQTVHDKGNGIDMEMSFVKFENGKGGWGARIKGTPREEGDSSMKTAVWFTVSAEGLGSITPLGSQDAEELGYAGDVILEGDVGQLGEFRLAITEPTPQSHPLHNHASSQAKPLDHTFVHSTKVPEEALWQSKGEWCRP